MKRTDQDFRGVLLSVGEVPLLEAAPVGGEDVQLRWQARELDVFLAELDAGGALPDLIVVPCGDPEALRALRGHHRSCCVPAFAGGAIPPGVVGWDGVVTDWTPALEQQVADLLANLEDEPSTAPLDSERRAHGFARFVASRGAVPVQVASTFGLLAPRTLLQGWNAMGWVDLPGDGTVRARPALADVVRAPRLPASSPIVPPAEPAEPVEPTAEVEGPVAARGAEAPSRAEEPAAAEIAPEPTSTPETALDSEDDSEIVESAARSRRAWVLPAAAILVAITVSARAVVDAGLLREGLVASWLLSDAAAGDVDWQAPVGASRLDIPQAHPALVRRLAYGDPAFRLPSSPPVAGSAPTAAVDSAVTPAVIVEVTPPAPSAPPRPPPPREFLLEVQVRHRLTPIPVPTDGQAIADWRVAVGTTVAAGQILAGLDIAELRARELELTALRAGLLARAVAAHETVVSNHALALDESARRVRHAEAVHADAEELRSERDRIHQRNLGLVEEGVLGYSEIRADWEALMLARGEAANAARAVEVAAAEEQNLRSRPAALAPAVDPVEALLLARLEEDLRTDFATAVLRAPTAGVLRGPLALVGTVGESGAAAATIESADPVEGSAVLPPDAVDLDWWALEARLETAPGVWMPVEATAIVRDADGLLQFRFRWPAAASAGAILRLVEPAR